MYNYVSNKNIDKLKNLRLEKKDVSTLKVTR